MKKQIIFFTLLSFLLGMMKLSAQTLDQHRWENRVLLIFTPDVQDDFYKKQIKKLEKETNGLKERKLFIYQLTPEMIKVDDKWKTNANFSESLYNLYEVKEEEFTIILVGLDGGEKLRRKESLSISELFAKIDQMPMRRNEINQKEKNK